MHAYDTVKGNLQWNILTDNSVYNHPILSLDNKILYFNGITENEQGYGVTYAVDSIKGTMLWNTKGSIKGDVVWSSPILSSKGDIIYSLYFDYVYANDANKGNLIWRSEKAEGTLPITNSALSKNNIIYTSLNNNIVAYDVMNKGESSVKYNLKGYSGEITANNKGDTIYTITRDSSATPQQNIVYAFSV